MRIVAGRFGGRRLIVPKGRDIRPTSDKVRGAVFNMLASRGILEGAVVMDGFCGTGALGLEALSRGAAHGTFIDSDASSLELTKENIAALGAQESSQCLLKDMTRLEPRSLDQRPVTLVFLDPPYRKDLVAPSLSRLWEGGWLKAGALVVVESARDETLPVMGSYTVLDARTYGDTCVTFFSMAFSGGSADT